jgi:hypothetical protein
VHSLELKLLKNWRYHRGLDSLGGNIENWVPKNHAFGCIAANYGINDLKIELSSLIIRTFLKLKLEGLNMGPGIMVNKWLRLRVRVRDCLPLKDACR